LSDEWQQELTGFVRALDDCKREVERVLPQPQSSFYSFPTAEIDNAHQVKKFVFNNETRSLRELCHD
jgi:hypothetical protein